MFYESAIYRRPLDCQSEAPQDVVEQRDPGVRDESVPYSFTDGEMARVTKNHILDEIRRQRLSCLAVMLAARVRRSSSSRRREEEHMTFTAEIFFGERSQL
jgi:hypothetical protein